MKKCNRCKKHKSLDSFHKNKFHNDGYSNICKICSNKEARENYLKRNTVLTTDVKCYICQKTFKSLKSLGRHLTQKHSEITLEEYYLKYISSNNNCIYCNKPTNFISLIKGFKDICNKTNCVTKKIKETKLKRYGDENYNNKEKNIKTINKKYGVDNIFFRQDFIDKRNKTNLKRYGFENPRKNAGVIKKIKISREKTMIERYGVKTAMHNPDSFNKMLKNSLRWKEMILPSGVTVKFQGYEDKAITELLKIYSEEEIVLNKSEIPKFTYNYGNKIRKYYPDFYIPKDNLIIEVKSEYYWDLYLKKNLAKKQICVNQGYNYRLMLYDGRGNHAKKTNIN